MTKAPTPTEKSKEQRDNTKTPPNKSRLHNVADRLKKVSFGNDSHPAGMVKQVYGIQTFQIIAKAVLSKEHTFTILKKKNPPGKGQGPTVSKAERP